MRQLCKRIDTECVYKHDDAAHQVEVGTAQPKKNAKKGHRKHLKHVDVDKMIILVLEEYDHQAELEQERVRKIAAFHDVDDDKEISLAEFSNIIMELAPGRFTKRKIRKFFLRLYDVYVNPSENAGLEDAEGEKAVGIPEVAAFCLAYGIFAPQDSK